MVFAWIMRVDTIKSGGVGLRMAVWLHTKVREHRLMSVS